MAYAGGAAASMAAAMHTSSYRVKFRRDEFLRLVSLANPITIFQTKRMHFFAFNGFVVYTFDCHDNDFYGRQIFHAIEFSNTQWAE